MSKNKKSTRSNGDIGEVLEVVNFIKEHMATHSEMDNGFLDVKKDIREIRNELKDIRSELEDLQREVQNISGYRKEIDHALERIKVIEQRLKMGR